MVLPTATSAAVGKATLSVMTNTTALVSIAIIWGNYLLKGAEKYMCMYYTWQSLYCVREGLLYICIRISMFLDERWWGGIEELKFGIQLSLCVCVGGALLLRYPRLKALLPY